MRFAILGSGSGGNAAIIQHQQTTILLDCGFTIKECCARLEKLSVSPDQVNAIVVTHEHGDHYNGVGPFSRRFNTPVYMTHGTWQPHRSGKIAELNLINAHEPFSVGSINISPFPVPHDAREPCQYCFTTDNHKLGFLTDTGMSTPHIENSLQQCDALVIEFNHDSQMLRDGPYPPKLQVRVGGRTGHLNNHQSSDVVEKLLHDDVQHLVAAHLSEKNNHPDHVATLLKQRTENRSCQVTIASQHDVSGWITLE